MMMAEPDGVLFAGDIVQNSRIPFMNGDDVDTANWLRGLAEVERLDPKVIIPGHGRPSTAAKEAIAFTRDYIEYVRAAMGKAAEDWLDFDVAYRQTDWSKYKDMPAFDNNNDMSSHRLRLLAILYVPPLPPPPPPTTSTSNRPGNDAATQ